MTAPFVSVVIPNYNYARYVGQAIDSVLAQTYRHREVVVIDNGSSDDSPAVLRSYGDRIRSVRQNNRGQSGARNRGIEESRGELIAFLDADDAWLPTKLERQVALFDRPGVGLVYCGYTTTNADGKPLGRLLPHRSGRLLRDIALNPGATVLAGESTAVVRRECFDRVGVFDLQLSLSAGWDMWRRIAARYEVEVVPEALTLYRQHGSNMHLNVDLLEHDKLIAFGKMFADPAAADIRPLRRRAFARLCLMLAGSFLEAGRPGKALAYGLRGIASWPPASAYVALLPVRRWRRRAHGRG